MIDTAIGSCSAEWWHIAEILSKKYKVIIYDRAGYGNSIFNYSKNGTAKNILCISRRLSPKRQSAPYFFIKV